MGLRLVTIDTRKIELRHVGHSVSQFRPKHASARARGRCINRVSAPSQNRKTPAIPPDPSSNTRRLTLPDSSDAYCFNLRILIHGLD